MWLCVCVNPQTIIWVAIHILIKNSSTIFVKVRWIWGGDFAEVQTRQCRAVSNVIESVEWTGWQYFTLKRWHFTDFLSSSDYLSLLFLFPAATTIPRHCLTCLLMCACLARSLSLRIQTFLNDENFFQPFLLPSFFLCIEKAFIKQNTSDVRWVLISLLPVVLLARLQGNKALSCATLLHKLRFFWVCL